jgi:hypothetical protein
MTEMPLPPPSVPRSLHHRRNMMIVAILTGLLIGLGLGIFVSVLFNLPSSFHTEVGVNNQVQVSGTVPAEPVTTTLYFRSSNGTMETSAPVINGQFSVLLIGGQSYEVFDYLPSTDSTYGGDYAPFYVPLGVTIFTENLIAC